MMAFELDGATKRFGGRTALNSVSLALPPGASLGLLGPNGAGKTTVLRLLLGMARPTGGTVKLQGLSPEQPAARRGAVSGTSRNVSCFRRA
jgi:ABC-type multidrug transport system ATPase subunit